MTEKFRFMEKSEHKTLIQWLDERCPPFLALALARKGTSMGNMQWITPYEIAAMTGISSRTIWRVFGEVSWEKHNIFQISKILEACRIDVFHMGRQREYMAETLRSENPYNHIPKRYRKQFMRRMANMARKAAARKNA
jgi:hypothetical protein